MGSFVRVVGVVVCSIFVVRVVDAVVAKVSSSLKKEEKQEA